MMTVNGIIMVASTTRNVASRPRQRMRENPYATIALEMVMPATLSTDTTSELRRYCRKSATGESRTAE